MVAVAYIDADFAGSELRMLVSEVHAHLADRNDICLAAFSKDILLLDIELFAGAGDNLVNRNDLLLNPGAASQNALCKLQIDILAINDRIGQQAVNDTTQLTDTVVDVMGDVIQHFIWDIQAVVLHDAMQDIAAQTLLRLLHLCHQTALESGDETFLHTL